MTEDQATKLRSLAMQSAFQSRSGGHAPPRILAVTAGQPGVGVSTFCVNLAIALSQQGARTVLVDADLERAEVAALCGLAPLDGIADVLAGRRTIHEVLQLGPGGIQVAVGASNAEGRQLCAGKALDRLLLQIKSLGRHADLVLLDAGGGPAEATARFCRDANEVLLLTTPEPDAVMKTYAIVKAALAPRGAPPALKLIVNRAPQSAAARDVHRRMDQSCQRFLGLSLEFAGWLPWDRQAADAPTRPPPFLLEFPQSPLALAVDLLAAELLAEQATEGRPRRTAA